MLTSRGVANQRAAEAAQATASVVEKNAVYRKVTSRLLPLLFICYFFNYLDRTNIGVAQLQMKADLGFSDAAYGLGAGLVYIGFIFFEVPSTVMLHRVGARRTLFRIMVGWGAVTCLTSLIKSPTEFYVARLLLGVAEAGFIPGILLYLSYWFPVQRRARITAIFLVAIPTSGVIGNPISGLILQHFSGGWGMHGWQWLFVLEGIPSIGLGIVALYLLADRPATAAWLTPREREILIDALSEEHRHKAARAHGSFLSIVRDSRIWAISGVLFSSLLIANTLTFWSPTIIAHAGISDIAKVGVLAAVPPLLGVVGMLLVGWNSDRVMERRWHTTIPMGCAATGLALLAVFQDVASLSVLLLSLVALGYYASLPTLYSLPSTYMSGGGAPAGIAVMTTVGSIGSALAPSLLGLIRNLTGSFNLGFQVYAGIAFLGSLVLLCLVPGHLLGETERPDA